VFTQFAGYTGYNHLTGIPFMKPRKVKKKRADIENKKFLASTIDIDGLQHDRPVTQVKIPYFFKVSIRENIGADHDPKNPIMATREETSKKPFPKEWDIESYTPAVIQFKNKCSKCHTIGIPRMDKKGMKNYHNPPYPSKQEEQYRLIYFHGKTTQCIIEKFHKNKGIFRKNGTISKTVKNLIFPNYLIKNI
jgi:hypothetical protein